MKQVLVDIKKCLGCRSCELACAVQHSKTKNLYQAVQESPHPRKRIFVESTGDGSFPLNCRHCDDAPCAAVCTTGAMRKDTSTGVVANQPEKCVGCWMCVMVCPFGAIATDGEKHLAVKCDRCPGLEEPACVAACPTGALVYQEVDSFAKGVRKQFLADFLREEGGNL